MASCKFLCSRTKLLLVFFFFVFFSGQASRQEMGRLLVARPERHHAWVRLRWPVVVARDLVPATSVSAISNKGCECASRHRTIRGPLT